MPESSSCNYSATSVLDVQDSVLQPQKGCAFTQQKRAQLARRLQAASDSILQEVANIITKDQNLEPSADLEIDLDEQPVDDLCQLHVLLSKSR